jgi:hypothetical protein
MLYSYLTSILLIFSATTIYFNLRRLFLNLITLLISQSKIGDILMFYTVQQINYILHHVIVSKSRITYFFNN